jgi:hypothetical protein
MQVEALLVRPDQRLPKQPSQDVGEYRFHHVYIQEVLPQLKEMHKAHWQETEGYRHALAFKFDYDAVAEYERLGQFWLFMIEHKASGTLIGNGACYVRPDFHTGQLVATEDTWYIAPEHRKGMLAARFLRFMEATGTRLGVRELRVSVKLVNKVYVLLERLGYQHVGNQYSKLLGDDHVQ